MRRIAAALSLAICITPAFAQDHWVASWGAASVKGPGETIPASGVTFRDVVHLSLGGKQIRLTFSNRFNAQPLSIGAATVAKGSIDGTLSPATLQPILFSGKPSTVIAPGQIAISDPVAMDAPQLIDLSVNIFLPAQTLTLFTDHPISHTRNYRAPGDQTHAASMPDAREIKPWMLLSAIDVMAPANDSAIVAFGDSITDGTGTTENANVRWPNLLANRLLAAPSTAHFGVVDEGIGSNRILHASGEPEARAGQHPSGVDRWSYDALDRAGVKYIILLEGVNDIGHSSLITSGDAAARQQKVPETPVTADDLIAADTKLIDRAHARGIKVIGATLTPFGGAAYERPDGEESHNKLNDFIRHSGKFDGVIDFEKATQDPAHPDRFKAEFNDKDHLHPNDAGAKAMADSIDVTLFQ